jgi:hypothetical protein
LLTAKDASSGEASSRGAVVEVAENMKFTLLACGGKKGPVVIKNAFFRGKTKNCGPGNSRCSVEFAPMIAQKIEREAESATRHVTKLLNSVHTLFTSDDSLAPCQRREIRNGEKNRQAKI